jgi:putative addiction module killer protein
LFEVYQTRDFSDWLTALESRGKARVLARISNMEEGNFGDHKSVGGGVLESRIHSGPGYRIYYTMHGAEVVLLLVGGDKSSPRQQQNDIKRAKKLAEEFG